MLKFIRFRTRTATALAACAGTLAATALLAGGPAQAASGGAAAASATHAHSAHTKPAAHTAPDRKAAPDRDPSLRDARQVCAALTKGHAQCMALLRTNVKAHRGVHPDQAPAGYGPSDLQSAYNLPSATAGSGQTVAIVDAYDDPDAEADLASYRQQYGLPACTTANGCFEKVNEEGQASPLPPPAAGTGWDVEESLDIDMVSAICPNCHIILVEADSDDLSDMYTAEDTAVSLGAKFVSNSWSTCEYSGETADDQYFNHPGVVITAAAGDYGYDNDQALGACGAPGYPAASQYVTSVGGTTLTQAPGTVRGWTETAWSSTGSGCSVYEAKPSWQTDTGCSNRTENDVSADADPDTGVAIYDSYTEGGWLEVGGTSVATPLIASAYALAGTPAAGSNPASYPYALPLALNDVTSGSDGTCSPAYLCTAGPGYDGPTGLGTPDGVDAFTDTPHGVITGEITSSATGKPVAGATVSAGQPWTVTTNAQGQYQMAVPAASYEVSVQSFGYKTDDVSVTVGSGQTVTENLTLTALPSSTLSGTVTDGSGHKWPLYAKISISGDPNPVYTDPYTGAYSVSLPQRATYQLQVTPVELTGYATTSLSLRMGSADKVKGISLLDAAACAAPGYQVYPLTEDFDAVGTSPPAGWTVTSNLGDGSPEWTFNDPEGRGNQTGGLGGFAIADTTSAGFSEDTVLTSPVFSLSGVADPAITFETAYQAFQGVSGDYAEVDLSTDGGQSWSSVWQDTADITGPDTVTIPVPQAAGQGQVQIRFHFAAPDSVGFWEVDDVGVGSCGRIRGGLVAGQVTDANTGDALDGATVASPEPPSLSSVTADAPGVADGFYEVFAAGSGKQPLTVTDSDDYATTNGHANVTPNTVTRQDFPLKAGHLSVSRPTVTASVTLGKSVTRKVVLTNNGTASAQVSLSPVDGGYAPPGAKLPAAVTGASLERIRAHAIIGAMTAAKVAPRSAPRQPSTARGGRKAVVPGDTPWTEIASYPQAIQDNAVAYDASNGDLYSIGGWDGGENIDSAYEYDPSIQEWTPITNAPAATEESKAAIVGGTLYLLGGWDNSNATDSAVYAYDLAGGTWSQVASLPAATAASGIAVLDGQIYVVGGCLTSTCVVSSAVYRYDPASNTWTTLASYPVQAAYPSCAGVDGEIACAGGINDSASLTSTYLYDPATGTWAQGADMPYDDWGAAYGGASGELQIAGGITGQGNYITNQAAEYNPAAGTWATLPNADYAEFRGGGACGLYQVGGTDDLYDTPLASADVLPGYGQCQGSTSWLSPSQENLTLAPHSSVTVTLALDTAGLTEPGTYAASLAVGTNTPYQNAPVSITLQVKPPATWGELTGTVTDAATGDPLPGATVQVCTRYDKAAGTCGAGSASYTLTTDSSGACTLWLARPLADNPVQVIAALPGYQSQAQVAKIAKDAATTLSFALSAVSPAGGKRTGR